jgi:hypothetical protein
MTLELPCVYINRKDAYGHCVSGVSILGSAERLKSCASRYLADDRKWPTSLTIVRVSIGLEM